MGGIRYCLGVLLLSGVNYRFATATYQATFAAGITGFIGGETVAATTGVRGLTAFAGNATLGFGAHGSEAPAALGAYPVRRTGSNLFSRFRKGGSSGGSGHNSCEKE